MRASESRGKHASRQSEPDSSQQKNLYVLYHLQERPLNSNHIIKSSHWRGLHKDLMMLCVCLINGRRYFHLWGQTFWFNEEPWAISWSSHDCNDVVWSDYVDLLSSNDSWKLQLSVLKDYLFFSFSIKWSHFWTSHQSTSVRELGVLQFRKSFEFLFQVGE